jgi:uncharacterized membrane protein YozB (DUF420 family)
MNILDLKILSPLAIGLAGFTIVWLLIAAVQFIRRSYISARSAAIIAAVSLVFLVVVMWDAHHHHGPSGGVLRF